MKNLVILIFTMLLSTNAWSFEVQSDDCVCYCIENIFDETECSLLKKEYDEDSFIGQEWDWNTLGSYDDKLSCIEDMISSWGNTCEITITD